MKNVELINSICSACIGSRGKWQMDSVMFESPHEHGHVPTNVRAVQV